MAKEGDFIEKLDSFTTSLSDLVEILKEQNKRAPTENLNQMLDALDPKTITQISEDIKLIKKDVIQINKTNDKILSEIKAIKKSKEGGNVIGDAGDKQNQNKLVEGVKTIILIAGAVLAIGMAFKLVGDVDPLSVISLGIGIIFVAEAFARVASIKDKDGKPITLKQTVLTSLTLVIMSAAILASGFLLKAMPLISPMTILSIIGVGLGMGLATFFLLKGIKHLSASDILKAYMVPVLLPLIAGGVVAAGYILQSMPTVGFGQLLSTVLLSIALVPMAFAFKLVIGVLKGETKIDIPGVKSETKSEINIKDVLIATAIIPLMSMGIVIASVILQATQKVEWSVVETSIAIGLTILPFAAIIWGLKKLDVGIDDVILGSISILMISAAIMVSSMILSLGSYDNIIPLEWVLGTALSIATFGAASYLLGMGGVAGLIAIGFGAIATLIVSATILASSYILGAGDYSKPIPLDWVLGTGLALLAFVPAMILAGVGIIGIGLGIYAMDMVANSIVSVAQILSTGKYDKFPTLAWSGGVGLSMTAFGIASLTLGAAIVGSLGVGALALKLGLNATLDIARTIVEASKIFAGGSWANGPTADWSGGVALAIGTFADVFVKMNALNLISSLFGGDAMGPKEFTEFVKNMAKSLYDVGEVFNKPGSFNEANVPTKDWAEGVGLSLMAFANVMASLQGGAGGKLLNIATLGLSGDGTTSTDDFVKQMLALASGLVAVGKFFDNPDNVTTYNTDNVPKKEWSEGVGGALSGFASAIKALHDAGLDVDVDDLEDDDGAIAVMRALSKGILEIGILFDSSGSTFDVSKIPTEDWSKGLGSALTMFADAASNLKEIELSDIFKIYYVGLAVSRFSQQMSQLEKYAKTFESGGISDNIINTIQKIVNVIPKESEIDPLFNLTKALNELKEAMDVGMWTSLNTIAVGIDKISYSLNNISLDKIDSLFKLSTGLNLLGLVDKLNLEKTLDVMEAKKNQLSSVSNDSNPINAFFDKLLGQNNTNRPENLMSGKQQIKSFGGADESKDNFKQELLSYVQNIDTNITKIAAPRKEGEEQFEGKYVGYN